ncbi:MAG: sialate O-acetylesterase [Planctomycetales bacterium]
MTPPAPRAAGSFLVVALAWCAPALADVSLPAVLSDGMVLQRERPAAVWGWAAAGEKVAVLLGGKQAETQADREGRWSVRIDPPAAGGPYELTVKGTNAITLKDVLVGEVWLCSGQSNMEWPVRSADDPQREIAAANHPRLRLFHVPHVVAAAPRGDVSANWQSCSPQTVAGFSAVAYFFGRHLQRELDVPIGLIDSSWGGTRIEPWTPSAGFAAVPELARLADEAAGVAAGAKPPQNTSPTALYNGMIHPLVPYGIRGAIWYQGESNRGDGTAYRDKMKGLILGWRSVWNDQDLPFYFVQLAPYRYDGQPDALGPVWEGQRLSLAVKNTGMAVTTDIGNIQDIHPRNKQEVGRRLALWALARTYRKTDIVYSGPLFRSMNVEHGKARLEFDHAAGLKSSDGQPLRWFDVAGADGRLLPADATIDGEAVVVSNESVPEPRLVRYGWSGWLDSQPNFVNAAGLPASPFRAGDQPVQRGGAGER